MKTDELQNAVARVAVNLDQARGLLVQARDEGAREWPKEMVNEEVQPSLEYRVYIDIQMLLEEYVEPGLSLARDTSSLTNATVTREWQADRAAVACGQEEMAALFAPPENDEDNPVPYFLKEVAAVMYAHMTSGKRNRSPVRSGPYSPRRSAFRQHSLVRKTLSPTSGELWTTSYRPRLTKLRTTCGFPSGRRSDPCLNRPWLSQPCLGGLPTSVLIRGSVRNRWRQLPKQSKSLPGR